MVVSTFSRIKLQVPVTAKVAKLIGVIVCLLLIGCGGSKKQTVDPAPPEPVRQPVEQPVQKPEETTAEEPVVEKKEEKIPLELKTVYFDYDKSDLRGDARNVLQQNVKVLKTYPEVNITIEGHCDERGTVEYNLALGDRRANAVKQYFIDLGIARNRISTISYGKERPVDFKRTEAAYAKNRRAEFVIR